MTYEEIVTTTRDHFKTLDTSKINIDHLAIQVDILGEGEGAFYIEICGDKVNIEPYEYYDRDVKFIATADDFMKIAYGSLNPVFAFTTGRLQVDGDIDKALLFQKIVEKPKKKKKAKEKKLLHN